MRRRRVGTSSWRSATRTGRRTPGTTDLRPEGARRGTLALRAGTFATVSVIRFGQGWGGASDRRRDERGRRHPWLGGAGPVRVAVCGERPAGVHRVDRVSSTCLGTRRGGGSERVRHGG